MDKIIEYLKQLDLSDAEAKLYLRLLQTGPTTVRDLAQTVDIKRTTAYFYIDQLVEKGLIMKLVRGSKKLVAANGPENLQYLVEKKVSSAKQVKQNLPSFLKALSISPSESISANEAEIKSSKGITNARKIYLEALSSNELRTYIRIDTKDPLFPDTALVFSNAFEKNPKLKIWEIIYAEDSGLPSKKSRSRKGRYFYKHLPKTMKLSSEDILIYDGKVAIINFRGGKTNIVLQSRDLYNNFKEIFDSFWNTLGDSENNDEV
jgi:HTH-type transcriptional regulator, sugar sensing transcriptional regulator